MIYIDPPFFSKADYDAVIRAGGENIRHLAYADKWLSLIHISAASPLSTPW